MDHLEHGALQAGGCNTDAQRKNGRFRKTGPFKYYPHDSCADTLLRLEIRVQSRSPFLVPEQ